MSWEDDRLRQPILQRPLYPYQYYDFSHYYALGSDGIFVFGSNKAGVHGAGAARQACLKHGAEYGCGIGFTGNSYAIPTKDEKLRVLHPKEIEHYIGEFVQWTINENKHTPQPNWYYITPVGTGLAGYPHSLIAPMFDGAVNCWFPDIWIPFLEKRNYDRKIQ